MVKVRTKFQPRHEIEVPDQEAQVLQAQGLLYDGTDEELAALLAADPIGPFDPRPVTIVPQDSTPVDKTATAAPVPADAKPPTAAKGA
jgi:hypothetical protein